MMALLPLKFGPIITLVEVITQLITKETGQIKWYRATHQINLIAMKPYSCTVAHEVGSGYETKIAEKL